MHTLTFWKGKKDNIEIPKMDLGVGEMGFIFCGKHPFLMTRIQASDPGLNSPLVYFNLPTENVLISMC